eukprot:EC713180.1.p3 GENE.EC713180.1~~EC713180.1.p3  ORF type:complete len:53 (-),score=2.45 EC713180.1:11-169(-)
MYRTLPTNTTMLHPMRNDFNLPKTLVKSDDAAPVPEDAFRVDEDVLSAILQE